MSNTREMEDFHKSLAEFRELTRGFKLQGKTKRFANLQEFHDYYENLYYRKNPSYIKKTAKNYKKSNIPSKIPFKREENPKEWMKQYGWFRNHPEATVYDPKPYAERKPKKEPKKQKKQKKPRESWSEISKKIPFKRSENPKEYDKQYAWFIINPEATVYEPKPYNSLGSLNQNPLITVTRKEDPIEYCRQYTWLRLHIHENPDKIPPRSISHHTKKKS